MEPEPKVNVLLVDDHPENLLALEAILGGLGQHLVKAHSGQEALRCLLDQDFAVILLDVQMPGMDGFETATLIRNRPRSRDTPIIFLTAFGTNDTLMFKGYSLGAVDYLLKPIEPEILLSKVTVFVDLFKKTAQIERQAAQLAAVNSELRESEERFRSLSACSPVGIFQTDVEGRCTYTNPRCQAICGFTLHETLQDGCFQSIHPDDQERVLAEWSTWSRQDREYSNEFRCQTPEGSTRWVQIRSSPMLSAQGQLLGHVGTVEDITDRKLAEEARAQFIREQAARQQAEATNRMKDEFLATLSHELRTPLNSILGWATLLRTRSFEEATVTRALETIERNAKSQAQLIDDILDVSRLIRGKLRLNLCWINFLPVIETAVDSVRPAAEAKGIQLEAIITSSPDIAVESSLSLSSLEDRDTDEPTETASLNGELRGSFVLKGDLNRLQQIVWNLLSNAIKFTPKGGRVEVRLERVGSYIQLKVSDTGMGITKEFLPYVFERFRQADSTTTRSHGGLGLGLAIVRHLVELHGGTIYADSEGEGKGAMFTVKLPLLGSTPSRQSCLEQPELPPEQNNSSIETSITPSGNLSGLQILIVDDDPDVRDLLIAVLEESGAKGTGVASVKEAIAVLERFQPDVLISDIGMPLEDGYSLIRKVRELEAQRGGFLPAIALTAYTREEDSKQAIASGFQMHLSKPVDTTNLIMVIANLAGSL
jgi:hypothetical protein